MKMAKRKRARVDIAGDMVGEGERAEMEEESEYLTWTAAGIIYCGK